MFIVTGSLPQCEADNYLMEHMVEPTPENMGTRHRGQRQDQPLESGRVSSSSSGGSDEAARASSDPELQSALAESKRLTEEDDHTLQRVLDQSRRDAGNTRIICALFFTTRTTRYHNHSLLIIFVC